MVKQTKILGRPTKYSEAIIKKTLEYIDNCEDETIQLVKQSGDTKNGGYEMFENKLKVKLPSVEGLAYELGLSKDTLYEWSKQYPIFSDALQRLKSKQARVVLEKGLSGEYNSTIAKLILSNNHGYKERTDTTSNDKDLIPESREKQEIDIIIQKSFR